MKRLFSLAFIYFISINSYGNAMLYLKGKFYANNNSEIGIKKGSKVYFFKRKSISEKKQQAIINSGQKEIEVAVDIHDITKIKKLKK